MLYCIFFLILTTFVTQLPNLSQHIQLPESAEDFTQAQRLFHGRGHHYAGLHHITVDWLPPVALITLFAPEPFDEINKFADKLLTLLPSCKSIQLQHRYQLSGPIDIIYGDPIQHFAIQEDQLKFNISLGQARNTGLFLDMRNGRRWVQQQSHHKHVLNLFAYTCGFSVAAIAGQAHSVLNVDMSSAALNVGRENHRLNQHALDQVKFEKLNIFKSFGRLKKRGLFDLLICDPPTFQKGSVDIVKDYPKIMRRLDDFMAPDATLMLCLNAPELDRSFLIDNMAEFAPNYKLVEEIKAPEVFIDAEDKGLKILCFKGIGK